MSSVNNTGHIPLQDNVEFLNINITTNSTGNYTISDFFKDASGYVANATESVMNTASNVKEAVSEKFQKIATNVNETGAFETFKLEAGLAFDVTVEAAASSFDYIQNNTSYEALSQIGSNLVAQAQSTSAYEYAGNATQKVADGISYVYESVAEKVKEGYKTASEKTSEQYNSFTSSLDKNWLPLTVFAAGAYMSGKSTYNAYKSFQSNKIWQGVKQIAFATVSGALAGHVAYSAYASK